MEMELGTDLFQDFDREKQPIIYIIPKLKSAMRRYMAIKREALVIKWAIEELGYYLA